MVSPNLSHSKNNFLQGEYDMKIRALICWFNFRRLRLFVFLNCTISSFCIISSGFLTILALWKFMYIDVWQHNTVDKYRW